MNTLITSDLSPHISLPGRGVAKAAQDSVVRCHLALVLFALVAFALLPRLQAVTPPPDGGYPGGNTAEGQAALLTLSGGSYNTAVGFLSLESNIIGNLNTAIGAGALLLNTADENTATGAGALLSNTTGEFDTANGTFALSRNTTGNSNTAVGRSALDHNTTGDNNTATGTSALSSNTTGNNNTATGNTALVFNIGSFNTANGSGALALNSTGNNNTATGNFALNLNTSGNDDTGSGAGALLNNTTGTQNTAIGASALAQSTTGDRSTAVGSFALTGNTTGGHNTALGFNAGINVTTASNVICIGADVAGVNVDNSCFIGNIFQRQVGNDSLPVRVDSFGKLGTEVSSRRFKRDIESMNNASEDVLALKPVTFHYKTDTTNTPQFGLIAEEVAEVNPHLVVRDKENKPYSVRYDQVNAMLLNEFLKEHRTVQELKREIAGLSAKIKEQDSRIEKVNDLLELSKGAPRTIASSR